MKYRAFWCALLVSGLSQSLASVPTVAQTLQQKTVEEPAAETPTETTEEDKRSAEEKELDLLLLGPWARLATDINAPLTNAIVNSTILKCKTSMQLSRLKFSSDAVRAFPENRKELVGDLVYFRTSKGIQSIDNRVDTMVLLPKVERATTRDGKILWALTNNKYQVRLRFTDTRKRGGTGEFMATNDGIYLRCIQRPVVAEQ